MQPIRFMRRPEVTSRAGFSDSTLFNRINEQTFVPPVSLGGRAVGWIDYEVDGLLAAMAAGKSKSELAHLVSELLSARKNILSDTAAASPTTIPSIGNAHEPEHHSTAPAKIRRIRRANPSRNDDSLLSAHD